MARALQIAVWAALVGCRTDQDPCHRGAIDTPDNLSPFELVHVDRERSQVADGYLLLGQFDDASSFATVIDGCADRRWFEEAEPDQRITRIRAARDGRSIVFGEYALDRVTDVGTIERIDPRTGRRHSTRAVEHHHDFVERPGGGFAWLSWQYYDNLFVPMMGDTLAADAIRVAAEGSTGDHRVLFSQWDDTDFAPWWTCSHMRAGDFKPGVLEWTHSNSLAYDEGDEAYYVLVRHWDAVLKVSAAGELLWVLGGPHNEFTVEAGTTLPAHGHMSEAGGGILRVFDNGNHTDRNSRAVELELDEDARTVRERWSWDLGGRATFLGDVRALEDGHHLVSIAPEGRIVELDADNRIVWEAVTDQWVARVELLRRWPLR